MTKYNPWVFFMSCLLVMTVGLMGVIFIFIMFAHLLTGISWMLLQLIFHPFETLAVIVVAIIAALVLFVVGAICTPAPWEYDDPYGVSIRDFK